MAAGDGAGHEVNNAKLYKNAAFKVAASLTKAARAVALSAPLSAATGKVTIASASHAQHDKLHHKGRGLPVIYQSHL
jgi:hypothetical protein